ncbi:DUF4829 domain-containing protein [Clostridium sp. CF012]|uniref:DUF4829 domain-containing protein n=1 Tax=Clostridium sp. CF012 TaxID=2843319 RepID=UPI001C0C2200|nr:DUF4829 domain-containing protein [Clostridium sp. CF012]MBU3142710.1 DUF4829 domain-containing protein [Clostridium sp. CF012]
MNSFKGKSFKWSLVGLSVITLIVIVFLLNSKAVVGSYKEPLLKPKEVIEQFFKYYNQKNVQGINSLTAARSNSPATNWGFDNLEYIKLINIVEDTNQANKETHIRSRMYIIDADKVKLELENIIIFKVDFEVKYKKEGVGPRDSGRDTYYYTLVRKDKNSPWLIDGYGY